MQGFTSFNSALAPTLDSCEGDRLAFILVCIRSIIYVFSILVYIRVARFFHKCCWIAMTPTQNPRPCTRAPPQQPPSGPNQYPIIRPPYDGYQTYVPPSRSNMVHDWYVRSSCHCSPTLKYLYFYGFTTQYYIHPDDARPRQKLARNGVQLTRHNSCSIGDELELEAGAEHDEELEIKGGLQVQNRWTADAKPTPVDEERQPTRRVATSTDAQGTSLCNFLHMF